MEGINKISCEGCADFHHSPDIGPSCKRIGVSAMIGRGIWLEFNQAYLLGKLRTRVFKHCPKKTDDEVRAEA